MAEPIDRGLMANLAETVSEHSVRKPFERLTLFGKFVLGRDPRVVPVHYGIVHNSPAGIPSWAEQEGHPSGLNFLPWPARFKHVAETIVHASAFVDFHPEGFEDAVPAVAYPIDESTVLAARISTEDPGEFFANVGSIHTLVGAGDVAFTVGLLNPHKRTLAVPLGAVSSGEVVTRAEAPANIRIY